jgi:hypothetical protein
MRLFVTLLTVILFSPLSLMADTVSVYQYTGGNFNYVVAPITTSDYVTGTFTTPTLGDNLYQAPLDVYSYDFTDGVDEMTGAYTVIGNVSTDATGAIVQWSLQLGPDGHGCGLEGGYEPYASRSIDQCIFSQGPYVESSNFGETLPDTSASWKLVSSFETPEPSTLALVGTGILGLAGAARRKFSRT